MAFIDYYFFCKDSDLFNMNKEIWKYFFVTKTAILATKLRSFSIPHKENRENDFVGKDKL